MGGPGVPLPEGHCLERLPGSPQPDAAFSSRRAQAGLLSLGPPRGPRASVARPTCRHRGHVCGHAASSCSRLDVQASGTSHGDVRGPLSHHPLGSVRGSCPAVCKRRSRHRTRAAFLEEELTCPRRARQEGRGAGARSEPPSGEGLVSSSPRVQTSLSLPLPASAARSLHATSPPQL